MTLSKLLNNVVIAVHNISSVHRVVEFTRIVTGFGFKYLIFTKVTGAAAQQGIPEAFRLAVKQNSNVVVLNDIPDIVDLIRPAKMYFLTAEKSNFKLSSMVQELKEHVDKDQRVVLVVNGSDLPFTPKEVQHGVQVEVCEFQIPTTSLLTIALYSIVRECAASTSS